MRKIWKASLVASFASLVLLVPGVAIAGSLPAPAVDAASCMGSGSSFYGTFAPQQRAFVAALANSQPGTPGATYTVFAQEKEGGAIPAPCGTRIE